MKILSPQRKWLGLELELSLEVKFQLEETGGGVAQIDI